MRLAILSDIHGNPLALDAVLADIQSQGEVDAYWVLGDFATLVYNIPPTTQQIREHEVPPQSKQGMTDFGTRGYGGPCPPSGTHRYVFQLFALDITLALPEGTRKEEVLAKRHKSGW